ncbi:TIGR00730 family Rossman fold protein [Anaerobacillus isosaccharinicus]|uniref:Cytokinin riboside 5'-monophosphate phosphoribohydrolase n=1 Tax=Anaerobacillus isosaccharinicus TaxID=1532552 RepID=A0A1S2LBW0_9BACI|nr:TIGR00730 family Rossman fold protein [Anaerobacillus isosaccharinicus]MBA5588142.1 TIGR00730 family Rossman fold protein [Anaerobacillus isosaccharinicus]QOY38404.1 TIGR00730 family Rossman fold protein [Anaerobacillus isosaccharinicus]
MKKIAVFCGSSSGFDPCYMEAARALGKKLAEEKIDLIYGGAQVGCMGAVADAVIESGGNVIGVIPKKLMRVEIAHDNLTELHVVETMHERKAMMAELADGFIAMPGGSGTLEEWFEVLTWAQIGYHQKPCSLLNVNNYYTPLLSLFDHMIEQGFVREEYRPLIIMEQDPAKLVHRLQNYQPTYVHKWD